MVSSFIASFFLFERGPDTPGISLHMLSRGQEMLPFAGLDLTVEAQYGAGFHNLRDGVDLSDSWMVRQNRGTGKFYLANVLLM